jgi:hypothetical protein
LPNGWHPARSKRSPVNAKIPFLSFISVSFGGIILKKLNFKPQALHVIVSGITLRVIVDIPAWAWIGKNQLESRAYEQSTDDVGYGRCVRASSENDLDKRKFNDIFNTWDAVLRM